MFATEMTYAAQYGERLQTRGEYSSINLEDIVRPEHTEERSEIVLGWPIIVFNAAGIRMC